MNDTLLVNGTSEKVILAMTGALDREGIRVVRSFDLRQAITLHDDECDCPYHGTSRCSCQYVVLLAYGDDSDPVVITAHTHGDATHVRALPGANTASHRSFHDRVGATLRTLDGSANPPRVEPPLSVSS